MPAARGYGIAEAAREPLRRAVNTAVLSATQPFLTASEPAPPEKPGPASAGNRGVAGAASLEDPLRAPRAALPVLSLVLLWGCAGTKQPSATSGEAGESGAAAANGQGGASATTGSGGRATDNTGGAGNMVVFDAGSAEAPSCGLLTFAPKAKNADILLVLDRSASMKDPPNSSTTASKWSIVVPTVNSVVTATASSVLWGMKSFPEGPGNACVAGSVTSAIDVKIAANNAPAVTAAINATVDSGNGTPTGDAINAAVTYLKSLTDTNPKYILLATDGEPSCAAIPTSESETNARPYAIAAVTNAKSAGFPTFVIGIGASTSDTTTLNQLADAGGEVPASATNPLAPHFYSATDMSSLASALDSITGQISSCVFPLMPAPPVPNNPNKLGVYLGAAMTKIPYDSTNADGWSYTDTNDTAVEVHGSWCTMIQSAGSGAVNIKYGCADIDVP
jgi:von Willebrand factor type A domain-containing protein